MPKLFRVEVTKMVSQTYTIVAESKKELYEALEYHSDNGDLDEWIETSSEAWDYTADAIYTQKAPPQDLRIDMGVAGGELLEISDYKKTRPQYREEIETEIEDRLRKEALEKVQTKLDF